MAVPKLRFKEFSGEYNATSVGSILKILHGKDYKDVENMNGQYPVYGTGGIIGRADKYLCNWACVCIGRKGTIDKPRYMDSPFWTVDTLFYSKAMDNNNPLYQYYLFQTINWQLYNEASGVPSLSASTIENINANIPSNDEQKKISEFLSIIDRKITLQRQKIKLLNDYKRGLFSELLETFCSTICGTELAEICDISKGSQLGKSEMIPNGVYYVLNGGLEPSGFTDDFNTNAGTISISEGGNSCGFVKYNSENFWSGGHCYTLNTIKKCADKIFLFHYLKFKEKDIMQLRVGSGLPNIQKSALSKFEIPLPDIQIQESIANVINKLQSKLNLAESLFECLNSLKQGLLQQMFI
jgi:type I restriction enzyme S subunit